LRFKVHGGTSQHGEHLCATCKYCHHWVEGGHRQYRCTQFFEGDPRIRHRVTACSMHKDSRLPDRSDFEEIAWTIRTSHSGKLIGFERPKRDET